VIAASEGVRRAEPGRILDEHPAERHPARPSPRASPTSGQRRPRQPSGRDDRPGASSASPRGLSSGCVSMRSANPVSSTISGRSGSGIAACATPAGLADRTPPDRLARPRALRGDAPAHRSMTAVPSRSRRRCGHSPTPTTRTSGRPAACTIRRGLRFGDDDETGAITSRILRG
jgi:hypothetical protein